MRSEEYRRLHQVCLDMAQQSELPDARVRWLKVAQASLDRSRDAEGSPLYLGGKNGDVSLFDRDKSGRS